MNGMFICKDYGLDGERRLKYLLVIIREGREIWIVKKFFYLLIFYIYLDCCLKFIFG